MQSAALSPLPLEEPSLLAMFLAAVRRNPAAPAVHYFDGTITYDALDRHTAAFATALRSRGIAPGDRVALFLQNVPQFLIALLGAWRAGAIVVPLNPMLKTRELSHHLADCGARVLVCLESLHDIVAELPHELPLELVISTSELEFLPDAPLPAPLRGVTRRTCEGAIDWLSFLRSGVDRTFADARPKAGDIATLVYTSGTTGTPKGAMNTHGNIAYNALVYREWFGLTASDVVVALAPLFHVTGLVGHLGAALVLGAPVVMFHRFDPAEALRLIERWRGTFTVASITAFVAMLECPDLAARDIRSLRVVASGGAPIAPATAERFRTTTGVDLHNLYGLTETTSPALGVPVGQRAPVDPGSGALSVGVPVPGVRARIIDSETGAELPPNTVGELVLSGPMVVPGYWQQPEASARAIRDGWLHTGDVAKVDTDGWFYIVDRSKDMIIASGFKVWPREVEDVLCQHPAVREAAVVGVPDAYRGETVKAFVSLRHGFTAPPVTPEELIAYCRQHMAAYKYPRAIEVLAELPKTASGKLLRRALRDTSSAS